MRITFALCCFLIALISLSLIGCSGGEPNPVEGEIIEDDFGRQVMITGVPERIISLTPSGTEILFALDLGPKMVGGNNYDSYPPEALEIPKVGDYENPNLESILALEPDLVLADSMHQKTVADLEELGVTALIFEPNTVQSVYKTLLTIGKATGALEAAENLVAQMQAEVEALTAPLTELDETEKPTVYYEIWHEPIITVGPQTYIHDLITLAGGRNVAANAQKAWPEFSLEVLLEADPQVIICPQAYMGQVDVDIEDFRDRRGWENISAVREGRIHQVQDDHISRAGPRLVKGLRELVEILHPDLYPPD